MEGMYLLIPNRAEWDDIIVIVTEEEAIEMSKLHPQCRVEIFSKRPNNIGYIPTHNYYKNGKYVKAS